MFKPSPFFHTLPADPNRPGTGEILPADPNRPGRAETLPYFPDKENATFQPPSSSEFLDNYLIAQRQKLTPVQAAAQNFGDLPVIGPLIKTIRDYEDRANYRDADPRLRKMMHLE
jgi:hypothetical protein